MHHNHKLDWQNISWNDFQRVSLHLAQNLITGSNFEIYLKEGHKQDGIDILSTIDEDGKYILIQCKREKSISKSELKKIVEEFVSQSFERKCSRFILSTSADLQRPILKSEILDIQEELMKKLQIKFECWDDSFMQEHLRRLRSVIAYYFNEEEADKHCFEVDVIVEKPLNNPTNNFIPRSIVAFNDTDNTYNNQWYIEKQENFVLVDLIAGKRLASKHICLLGDPHQGKSFLLRQTAWELERISSPFSVLLIELKSHATRPIATLLNEQYSFWKQIPIKDLVLFIDGVDEVPTDQFDETVRNIADFISRFPAITVVFSCRKLFYKHYKLKNVLQNFSMYELAPLQYYNVVKYLESRLGNQYANFNRLLDGTGISSFLHHPFYLTNLVSWYLKPPHKLPANKIQMLEKFIDSSLQVASIRRIKGGNYVHQKIVKYRGVIQKFALAMQLSGLNSLKDEDVQLLFSDDTEIELLQHNSLVSIYADNWSFSNALFQEHLAALVLSKMSFDEIISTVAVGTKTKKIRTKWIQTVASLLSILETNGDLYKKLFEFIAANDIEVVFTAEKSKIAEETRLHATKSIIEKCRAKDIRPMLIYEETIAVFIDQDDKPIDFLLKTLGKDDVTERVKITICRILCALRTFDKFKKKFLVIALREINKTSDPYYAKQLFEVMGRFQIGDKNLVSQFISCSEFVNHHDYRSGLYGLIVSLNLAEDFYQFALDGMGPLISYNKGITHAGSEYSMQNLLLSTNKVQQLKQLFGKMSADDWLEYYDSHSSRKEEFLTGLSKKAVQVFQSNPSIIFTVVRYLETLDRKHLREEFSGIEDFFVKTKTQELAVRILINRILNRRDWEFSNFITLEILDYLLFEFEEKGDYETGILWSWFAPLRNTSKKELADKIMAICNDVTEGKILEDIANSSQDEYTKFENLKRTNDLKYIQSADVFKKAVLKYFEVYGKKTIPEEDMYIEFDHSSARKQFDSNFIFNLLVRWLSKNKKATLESALKVIDNPASFEFFRAYEITTYNFVDSPEEEQLKSIAESYYQREIVTANFTNAIVEKDNRMTWLRRERLLGQIFEKFHFETPIDKLMELVWLDLEGIRSFSQEHSTKEKKSISHLIIERLNEEQVLQFSHKILEHLKTGIKSQSILGSHVALCKYLNIYEARDFILELVVKNKISTWHKNTYVDIYIHLEGDTNKLASYFKKINDYNETVYLHLAGKLISIYPEIVQKSLLSCIKSLSITSDIKIGAARHLIQLGNNEGFLYLKNLLIAQGKAPYTIQSGHKISNIDTSYGLKELEDVVHMLIAPEYNDRFSFHDSAKSIILEWLSQFAAKSEDDLNMVTEFLYSAYEKLKSTYPNAKDIFWHIERFVENFRDSDKTVKSIAEIKQTIEKYSA